MAVTPRAIATWLAALWLLPLSPACGQADIYAVTGPSGSVGDAMDIADTDVGVVDDSIESPGEVTNTDVDATDAAQLVVTTDESAQVDATDERLPVCPQPALEPGDTEISLQVGDVVRSYILHVPAAYDGRNPVPLIVDFHGMGSSAADELAQSPYPSVTDGEGVVMAFPDGLSGPLGKAWNMGPCCVRDVDDLAFARALVAHVQQSACIDPARVYAVGVLTGGGMVHHLACEAADLFAAVSPSAFDLLEETVTGCEPSRPITVMSFRGTEDTRVPYEGGPSSLVPGMPITFLGAESTLVHWAEINGCTGPPSEEDEHGCVFHSDCSGGVEVSLCTDHGGREAPGAADVAWPVLKRHTR